MKLEQHGRGFTLIELLVTAGTGALMLSLLMPTLSASREQARRQQCAINQKKIMRAYALWGQDHSGFWPPRCGPADGCTLATNVEVLVDLGGGRFTVRRNGTAYYDGPRNDGLGIVGVPQNESRVGRYPLNSYVTPGWQFGDPFDVTNCPSDDQTVLATSSIGESNLLDRGFAVGDIGSAYEFFGTSYVTNTPASLPWRGHGNWAGSIVASPNKMEGPNYNPDLIYRPGAYVAGFELGPWYPVWNKFLGALSGTSLGTPVEGASWHESKLTRTGNWLNANAYHADGHVTFARRQNMEIIGEIIPRPSAQCFITPEWSLFPLKIPPPWMSPALMAVCTPSP